MKKSFGMLLAGVLLAVLPGCAVRNIDVDALGKSHYDAAAQSAYVTMTPDSPSVKQGADTLALHFENSSDWEYTFGMEPHLDIAHEGVWYTVPTAEGASWIEIAYALPAGESFDIEFPLKTFYGILPAGHYRIVKPLYSEAESAFAIAEFTIE